MHHKDWKSYNNALISTILPHEEADISVLNSKDVWQKKPFPFFARWTSDFDCKEETNWWYVIKDNPFDIDQLKAKRRYEINKGINNFTIKEIDPNKYSKELYYVYADALQSYGINSQNVIDSDKFAKTVQGWDKYICLGAFSKEDEELGGYALLEENGICISFIVLKAMTKYEKKGINAVIVNGIMDRYKEQMSENKVYICDGQRSIYHKTKFQDYLEKYFGFRKAYCRLNVRYRKGFHTLFMGLYAIRGVLRKFDKIPVVRKINAVLKMEDIVRNSR